MDEPSSFQAYLCAGVFFIIIIIIIITVIIIIIIILFCKARLKIIDCRFIYPHPVPYWSLNVISSKRYML